MSDKVIDLDANRPHVVSLAICVACSYRWTAVIPKAAKKHDMECPRCHEMKGTLVMMDDPNE